MKQQEQEQQQKKKKNKKKKQQQQQQQWEHDNKSTTTTTHDGNHHYQNNSKSSSTHSGFIIRQIHKNLNDEMFREVLEEKMQKIRRVRTLSDAQMVIHVQNNHLTDASISTLAKYCQQYLQFLSRRSVLSSSSSSSSCSSKRDHKRKYRNNGNNREIIELEASISSVIQAKFDLNFSSNELQGRSLLDLFEVMERLPSLCISNLNMSWNQLGDARHDKNWKIYQSNE